MNIYCDFATRDDLPALADLLTELFSMEQDFQPDRAKQLAGLTLILDHPSHGRLFVARRDGRVVAMANALITLSTAEGARVLLLEDVIVEKNQRGLGVGRQLVQHVLDWARGEGMTRATLLTDGINASAQAFYRRMGFTLSDMRVMRCRL